MSEEGKRFQSGFIREDKLNNVKEVIKDAKRAVNEKIEKWANKLVVGGTVKKHYEDRVEGETWFDSNGKQWTRKNGIAQSISKLQDAKTPWFCPRCEKVMNTKMDDKFWRIRGHCFDCQIQDEHKMRLEGTYEAYERRMLRLNEMSWIRDAIEEREAYIREFKVPTVYFENGGYQQLAEIEQFAELFDEIRKDVEFLRARFEVLEKEQEEDDANQTA
jgi:hypothetical protein